MNKEVIAAFDFDGTLTRGMPSRLLFLQQLVGTPKLMGGLFLWLCRSGLNRFKMDRQSRDDYLDRLFLQGRDKDELKQQAALFFDQVLMKKLRKEALKRLEFHQQQGHTCIIVSGAWDIYLKPLAQRYDFKQLICTQLEFDPISNKSTGRMLNEYCLGQQKLVEFKKRYTNRNGYILYAYGDSHNDLELLDYADYAFYRRFQ
jgi:phosphatidylglycerophosphatase C